jgi:crossover junction endodeoxyribonuclease RuvC
MIYGLDLSLVATGISNGQTTWLIPSKGKAGASLPERNSRLSGLRGRVLTELAGAELVVIEGPAFASKMGSAHDRSGLWWLIVADLHDRGIPVAEVPPTSLKRYATGKGNANKGAMVEAATRRFPDVETSGDDNRCDALFLAAMGHDRLGRPLTSMPAAHRSSLGSVRWPTTSTPHLNLKDSA